MTEPRRLRTIRRSAAILTTLVLAGLFLPFAVGAEPALAEGAGQTVTGRQYAYDVANNTLIGDLPTATVDQAQNLVDQTVHVAWTGLTPSSNDLQDPIPQEGVVFDPANTDYAVAVLQCRGAHPQSIDACYFAANGQTYGASGIGNEITTVTNPDGTGYADLHVEDALDNTQLGCDLAHPCSIVVFPMWGGRQTANTPSACNDHSQDYDNVSNGYNSEQGAFIGKWAFDGYCSWLNRLVIPIHFAPSPTNCPAAKSSFTGAGSPMLERAMQQWRPGWCRGPGSANFDFNSTNNEYQARLGFQSGSGALTAATDVAFVSRPADGVQHATYAPIANTDIAIAFIIDDPATGNLIPDINLNARLVAKMLTESYAPTLYNCTEQSYYKKNSFGQTDTCDPAVRGNPSSILTDPEFRQINPQLTDADFHYIDGDQLGAYFPTVVSGDSDLTYELTRWVASDPSAEAFLKGQPDGWGMRVNSYYKGIEYPVDSLVNLDPGYTNTNPGFPAGNGTMQNAWQPISGLGSVGTLLAGNTSSGTITPVLDNDGNYRSPKKTELIGDRNLWAIMDQAQAAAYKFPVARLINAAGVAVAPTTDSVTTGLHTMKRNPDGVTMRPNYTSTRPGMYPLSIVDYAMVRTCGYDNATANGVRNFLYKVSQSQTYGVQPGTIAPGYLALGDGQLRQLNHAASLVSSSRCDNGGTTTQNNQHGQQQNQNTTQHNGQQHNGNGNSSNGSGGGGGGSGTSNPNGTSPGSTSNPNTNNPSTNTSTSSPGTKTGGSRQGTQQVAYRLGKADTAGAMRYAVPILLIVGGALLVCGPLAYFAATTGLGPAILRRLRL